MVDPARVAALLHRIRDEIDALRELGARNDEQSGYATCWCTSTLTSMTGG